nr:HypC/HybG/HupF family hydrogenase formation chaperone [Smithellaceae bacterium]
MCIGFPGIIISIDENNYAVVDISGTRREVCLDIVDEPVAVGDYVITHAGF